ncbi:high nitrogen upregulated cytochrome P450 monooxygenase 2 [Marasmius fiardii PR-910]|nr:high nitrogen upregulated cytochrome P450 monooxygenase 2 [Marasmius fiardii PR-910]
MADPGSLTDGILFSVFCGLVLHLLFQKLEKTHLESLKRLALITPILPSYVLLPRFDRWPWFWASLVGYSTCYSSLLTSIVLYRLSPFHPLAQHPGPLLARCTKFWGVYQASTGKMHLKYMELHRRYGPIVRTGPNELSICDANAVQPILGSDGLGKGNLWDGRRLPHSTTVSHIGIRNTSEHLKRRKPWNKAFTTSRIKAYEPIMRARLLQLQEKLDDRAALTGKSVDLAQWLSFFAYDFMGDMAFGAAFELMRDGDVQGLWKMMEDGIGILVLTQHVPWLSKLVFSVPGVGSALGSAAMKLEDFVNRTAAERQRRGSAMMGEDISTYLLDEGSPNPRPPHFEEYANEAILAIVAGSDTTATALSCAFYHLICDKTMFLRLRNEIDAAFPVKDGKAPHEDTARLAQMPFLNAVMNESLRLYPAVPTSLQRSPEPGMGGKVVSSIFIPEDTPVNIPAYVLHRDPRYFAPDPERFWPDRWIVDNDDETVETNRDAFIPFSVGPMSCVGKQLAQLELRCVIATLVQRFEMEFDTKNGWRKEQWEEDLEDCFVFKKGVLPVLLRRREGFNRG